MSTTRRNLSALLLVSTALSLGACSWARFNKLKKDAPVARLDAPKKYDEPFGMDLAVLENDETALLYVGTRERTRGGLSYRLGLFETPQENPNDKEHCLLEDGDSTCSAVVQSAGLNRTWAPSGEDPLEQCFVSGVGEIAGEKGLWARCYDGSRFVFKVDAEIYRQLKENNVAEPRGVRLASSRGDEQVLFASTQMLNEGWFYEPLSRTPIAVPAAAIADKSLGSAVSVLKVDAGHLLAWAAVDAGQVFLYRVIGANVEPIGCLGDGDEFGRALAAGDVDGDGQDDLLVAAAENVSVFSGAALSTLLAGEPSACSLNALPADTLLAQLSCQSGPDTADCGGSEFGAALAVFDSDGDGRGEIAVGAPKMDARDRNQVGAVLVYADDGSYLSSLIASDGKDHDLFGSSLSPVAQETREILAIGAPGGRRVYLQYCAGQADAELTGRCY